VKGNTLNELNSFIVCRVLYLTFVISLWCPAQEQPMIRTAETKIPFLGHTKKSEHAGWICLQMAVVIL